MPKVIDLPTETTMDSGDYFVMEESSGGTKKITRANSVDKISSPTGLVTRVSGSALNSAAYRTVGKMCYLYLVLQADQAYGAGNNAFNGTVISGYRPAAGGLGTGYTGSTGLICNVGSDGTLTVRVIGGTLASGTQYGVSIMYIMA